MFRSTAAICALALPTALAAQQPDDPDASIIVTGTALPDAPGERAYSDETIERDELAAAPSGRVEDALAAVSGFQQFRRSDSRASNPSAQGVTLRGLGGNASSRALVTLDGVPLADPFFGFIPLSSLDPQGLAQVRVRRGGGSGPFGSGALSGTIDLTSAGPDDLGRGTGRLLVNDRGETEASVIAAPRIGAGHAVIAGRWDRGQGFFTAREEDRVPASVRAQFDSWSASARLVQPLGEAPVELQASFRAFDDKRTFRFDGADSRSSGEDASIRLVGRGDWAFDALLYGQWRNFTNVVISSTRFVPVLDQKATPSSGFGGKFEIRPPVGPDSTVRLGLDYRTGEGEIAEDRFSAFSGNLVGQRFAGGRNSDLGLFAEFDHQLGELLLTAGIRADRWTIADGFFRELDGNGAITSDDSFADRSGWQESWRIGASYAVSGQLDLRGAAYTGLRVPTLNELYRPFVIFPLVTQANAALDIERLEGFEAGLDWRLADGVALSVTAFENRVEGAIANVTIAQNLRQRRNLGAVEARGLEVDLAARWNALRLDGSLSLTDAEIVSDGAAASLDGNRPPQVPEISAYLQLSWSPTEGALLAVTLRHVGEQFEDDAGALPLKAATTLGLYAEYALLEGVSFLLRGENLLDEEVITRNTGSAVDLGAPRTVWAGLQARF